MEIKKGQTYKGNINNEKIEIIDVNNEYITYKALKTGRKFTISKEAFKHCNVTPLN